ncbi:MAG: HAMP domain-containing sensor histidine kinase [Candidatus Limivicinus sp.]|nr:HAMP domain-containing sensor histidine kinase [Candidatus Limivicinus sp.]
MTKPQKPTPVKRSKFNYGFIFSSAALVGSLLSTALAMFIVWLLNRRFGVWLGMPYTIRVLLISILSGAAIAVGLSKIFVSPMMKLGDAMRKVAGGDFTVRLDCTSRIRDVREVYGSFNTMVKELGNTETLQTDFVSNVSHEFKTPINAIEGYASLLQDSQLTDEQKNAYIDKIIFNTRRLSDLVGNILLLSKVNNQTISLKASTFRLDEQVRQSILALESKWEKKEIEFDIDLDEIEYTGYENLLSHVWLNLIDNAVKFSPQNGQIRIRLKQLAGSVTFSIWDNGLPIPEADIGRIFNKFYQGDNSHASEGNGLGLALVRKIVAAAHGTINVTSSEDAGTEFVVALPNSSSDS